MFEKTKNKRKRGRFGPFFNLYERIEKINYKEWTIESKVIVKEYNNHFREKKGNHVRKRDKDIRKRQLLEIIKEDQEKAKGLVKNEMWQKEKRNSYEKVERQILERKTLFEKELKIWKRDCSIIIWEKMKTY